MRRFTLLPLLLCLGLRAAPPALHTATEWQIKPSLKYDALCLLNALSGDPYYLHYYQAEYDHFHPLFTPNEQAALQTLKRVIKDENSGIVSASLTSYYSVLDDETLPQMIRTAHDPTTLEAALKRTGNWSEDDGKLLHAIRPALETSLQALNRVGFTAYWTEKARPRIEKRIAELSPSLPKNNIIPAIESYLGFPLPSQTLTVYLLAYSEPHGIRITGLRFITHVSYPFEIVLHNAIHESMHPPFHADDPAMHQAIELLGKDPLIVDKVKNHDPSFGYNTAPGYIDEDSVQALEQIVSEKFGVGRDPKAYWRQQDGGMHVLAAAIYVQYKKALSQGPQEYSKWFIHAVEEGHLRGAELGAVVRDFFALPK